MFFQFFNRLCCDKSPVFFIIKFSVIRRRQPCIGTDDKLCMLEIFYDLFFQWNKRLLFVFISRMDRKGKRDTVTIHEQPHFYNRVRAVFFGGAVLFQPVLLFNLKKEVGAVIKQDLVISFGDRFTIFIQFRLDITIFRTNDIQSPVNML
ncbi:hypothetical protein IMSAGC020_02745 [Lachnospiraceae bacterium]|nr:hypothetical protein IMSAGC020_02745 [Lachnospiraceae bacterium]